MPTAEIPQVLIVRNNLGLGYSPAYGPPTGLSLVKVDADIDLDGPQLDLAARIPDTLRYSIALNDWTPDGFQDLPVQLQPYVRGSQVYADDAPTRGVWRSGQVVHARLNSSNADNGVIGWRCIKGGKPGQWKPWRIS